MRMIHVPRLGRRLVLLVLVLVTLLALLTLFATEVHAQVVRGTVTEEGSGAPLSGVLVTLERLPDGVGGAPSALLVS